MPRVTQHKAAKDYPDQGIAKGDVYFQWKPYRGGVRRSKTQPRASQLTQSHWSGVYAARESIEDWHGEDPQELADLLNSAADALDEVSSAYGEAVEAMGAAGEQGTMADRALQLDELAQELRDVAGEASDLEMGTGDSPEEETEDHGMIDELRERALDLEWEPSS